MSWREKYKIKGIQSIIIYLSSKLLFNILLQLFLKQIFVTSKIFGQGVLKLAIFCIIYLWFHLFSDWTQIPNPVTGYVSIILVFVGSLFKIRLSRSTLEWTQLISLFCRCRVEKTQFLLTFSKLIKTVLFSILVCIK